MENLIYLEIQEDLRVLLLDLSHQFKVCNNEALSIVENDGDWNRVYRTGSKNKKRCRSQCVARVWNNGYGGRCSASATEGSEFCLKHCQLKFPTLCQGCVNYYKENRYHDYVWQHLGRYDDDTLPSFFKCQEVKNI